MKNGSVILISLIGILLVTSCKKTTIKKYVYCKDDCKFFQGRVLNHATLQPMPGLTILIRRVYYGWVTGSSGDLGYFETDANGIFSAKVNNTDFSSNRITISVYQYSAADAIGLGSLASYPDTVTNYIY